jgi:MinD-like ATPase involved in chromosome partitioning or flagellar assembly
MIIGFISVKGGVGKTTLALETAASLANDFGKKVLLIDANFSAPNLALHFGFKPELTLHDILAGKLNIANAIYEMHGFDFIPASMAYREEVDILKLRNLLNQIKGRYDFIILDSAPNYKEMVPVISSAEKLFVVTTPDHVTLHTSLKAANLAKAKKTPIEGVVINKIRDSRYELSLKDIEQFLEVPVLARISDDKEMVRSVFFRKPLVLHNPSNKISKEVRRFASALAGSKERVGWFMRNFGHYKKEKVNRELLRQKFY